MQVMHRDIEVDLAARRFDADDHGLGVGVAGQALIVHVNFRRENFEAKALIVEQRDGISDDHVGEFADRFARDLFAFDDFGAGELACHLQSDFRSQIKNYTALDFAFDDDERGNSLAAIGFLVHGEVDDFGGRLQGLRKDGVGGVDERLDELHSHERSSPASATGAPAALGSSLST